MSSFEREREVWATLGDEDPLWAILSEDGRQNNAWDIETFFERGRLDADVAWHLLAAVGAVPRGGDFLDFGCGVGRVARHLCDRFERGVGVDVSGAMIERAIELNPVGERMRYQLNESDDLSLLGDASFDLVYSGIALQHIPPPAAAAYIREFVRILRPGGIALFQVPSHEHGMPTGTTPLASDAYRARLSSDVESIRGRPGAPVALRVIVVNESIHRWPNLIDAAGEVFLRLGNHWLAADGTVTLHDQARCQLMHSVAPGTETHLGILVNLPDDAGNHLLEFDLVQEGVTWFAEKGSPTLRIPVTVEGDRPPRVPPNDHLPEFGMYPIPRPEVEGLIADAAGEVVAVCNANCSGPTWADYWYVVRRPAGA